MMEDINKEIYFDILFLVIFGIDIRNKEND